MSNTNTNTNSTDVHTATVQFIGVGGAFAGPDQYQSNALVTAEDGSRLLIDCGSQAPHALLELGIGTAQASTIDGVYISHLHSDHVGGMEWLAFSTYFNPTCDRPKLYGVPKVLNDLWSKSLRGGLESIQGKQVQLTDYFDVRYVRANSYFEWHGLRFEPVQTIHVVSCRQFVHSYGLLINNHRSGRTTFFTSDTQYAPSQLNDFYKMSDLILHDCETSAYRSGVHAHYEDLRTLPPDVKNKMFLYHYSPVHSYDVRADGFGGFVLKHDTFAL